MKPVAIGPTSRTVIGDTASPSVASLLKPKKPAWKQAIVPAGIVLATYLVLVYKGYA